MLPSLRFVGACPVRKCPERPPLWQGGWGRCPESKTFQGGEGGENGVPALQGIPCLSDSSG